MIDFCGARLRSNPRFRLVAYDALATHERDAFRSLSEDSDFFGILVPPEGSVLPVKSVSRDAALLFLALQEPAHLPHLLGNLFGSHAPERLRSLILDGVFEIEQSGQFVSGAAALSQFGNRERVAPTTRLSRLCADAIDYAAALELVSVGELAVRLYLFNAAPGRPEVHRRFASDEGLLAFLFEGNDVARLLRSRWRSEPVDDAWIAWRSAAADGALPYKLYVSPALEHLPGVFAASVQAFAKVSCTRFKLGRRAFGVLRPDKLVAYFPSLDALQRAADLILTSAPGAVPHGVPFTAPIDPDGLLSWAMDPPRFEQVLASQENQSWRQWLTGRIAVCVSAAKEGGADVHSFLRSRIELDGIDPVTWNPNLAIWRGPVGTEREVT